MVGIYISLLPGYENGILMLEKRIRQPIYTFSYGTHEALHATLGHDVLSNGR